MTARRGRVPGPGEAGWRHRRVRAFARSLWSAWRVDRDRGRVAAGTADRCIGPPGEMPGFASGPRIMPIRAVSSTILTLMGRRPAIHDFVDRIKDSRGWSASVDHDESSKNRSERYD